MVDIMSKEFEMYKRSWDSARRVWLKGIANPQKLNERMLKMRPQGEGKTFNEYKPSSEGGPALL